MAVKEPGADGLLEGALCRSPGSTWYAMGAGSGLSSASFFRTASEKRLLFSSSSTMSVSWTILHIQGWSQTVGLDAGKGKGNATGPLPVKRVLSCIALAQRDILHKLSQTAGLILLIFFYAQSALQQATRPSPREIIRMLCRRAKQWWRRPGRTRVAKLGAPQAGLQEACLMISASSSNTRGLTVAAPFDMLWLTSASSTLAAFATARPGTCFYPHAGVRACFSVIGRARAPRKGHYSTLALAAAPRCHTPWGAAGAGRVPHCPSWPRLESIASVAPSCAPQRTACSSTTAFLLPSPHRESNPSKTLTRASIKRKQVVLSTWSLWDYLNGSLGKYDDLCGRTAQRRCTVLQ